MKFRYIFFGAIVFTHAVCWAGSLPREPEADNGEYLLDVMTNAYSRPWREIWDGGDNRFRFRLGSNNVAQWFLEEELKFSTSLTARLRIRYHHARLLRNSSEQLSADTFEFEGKIYGNNYLSVFATPTFSKSENSLGIMLQNRRAVNECSILFIEFPQLFRNFGERRKGGSDSLLSVFTDKPIRFGVDIREHLTPTIWIRLAGEFVPSFEMADEVKATGLIIPKERVKGRGLGGWAEYVRNGAGPPDAQTAFGLDWGYRKEESTRPPALASPSPDMVPKREFISMFHRAPRLLEMEFDGDLFNRGGDDSVVFWRETRWRAEPYAWLVLNPRHTVRAAVRIEGRTIEWQNDQGERRSLEADYIVPTVAYRVHLGSRRQSIIDAGIASEFRTRREEIANRSRRTDRMDDHRIYIAYEHVFGEAKAIRIVEAIELDGEDVGEFRIHDHGFFQFIFGF